MRMLLIALLAVLPAAAHARPSARRAAAPVLGGCAVLPADNIWNARVDALPLDPRSSAYVASIGSATALHPDFGTFYQGAPIGIPYVVVSATQPQVPISFGPSGWPDESDPGPMPIPANAPIEGGAAAGGDRHVLVVRQGECKLYELYRAFPQSGGAWRADSTAIYDLSSNALRPDGWTSADAAGLPILPGLLRFDEVQSGEVAHAIRFTAETTQNRYVWPARHFASSNTDANVPPMGQRFRLKASVDISGFSPEIQVIFTAFKRYGIILADNGSDWYVTGTHDTRWNDDMLVEAFAQLQGSDFEAVDVSGLQASADSGQVRASTPFTPTHFVRVPLVRR
jgi:hypothetical protein